MEIEQEVIKMAHWTNYISEDCSELSCLIKRKKGRLVLTNCEIGDIGETKPLRITKDVVGVAHTHCGEPEATEWDESFMESNSKGRELLMLIGGVDAETGGLRVERFRYKRGKSI